VHAEEAEQGRDDAARLAPEQVFAEVQAAACLQAGA
jgi:hypothetical protein